MPANIHLNELIFIVLIITQVCFSVLHISVYKLHTLKLESVFHTWEWNAYTISGASNLLSKGNRKQIRILCYKRHPKKNLNQDKVMSKFRICLFSSLVSERKMPTENINKANQIPQDVSEESFVLSDN